MSAVAPLTVIIFRLGSPCPANHNPADFFIQLLAIVPSQEEECRNKIQKICDSYENSDYAQKLYKECSRQRESKVMNELLLIIYLKGGA